MYAWKDTPLGVHCDKMHIILYLLVSCYGSIAPIAAINEDHAIYLSTIKMEVKSDEISITIKVFEDDLRDALRSHHGYVIDTTSTSFNEEIESYFEKHVINFSTYRSSIERLHIKLDYFMELFPTQQNVLHLINKDQTKYHIFKKGNEQLSLD